ncbi:MAG: hypothetical protein ABSB00_02525 [Minisyncoccia bacterium]|jgi:hypothetical protein
MNNSEQSIIEKNVMRRVRIIRVIRPIISSAALAAIVCVLALWGIGREVWVARVFQNGPQDFIGHSFYLVYAFEHTRFIVQALVLLTLASVIYLARETARAFSSVFTPVRI